MTTKMLVLFSDPPNPDGSRLRLDREDRLIAGLARRYQDTVSVERLHASTIDDIHNVILDSEFDYIHFSGHGSKDGIYLDRNDLGEEGEMVSVLRLRSLLSVPPRPPVLVVLLSCYSHSSVEMLAEIAPFVISGIDSIDDEACIQFTGAFYDRLFRGYSIQKAFYDAEQILKSKSLSTECLRLSRRQLIKRGSSHFIESRPDPRRDSILVNVDQIADKVSSLGLQEEVLYEMIAKKLSIHRWIFAVPRDRCVIPIGRMLFGEFMWRDASDVVYCTGIVKLAPEVSSAHWQCWSRLLICYNDLASSEYRAIARPGDPANRALLGQAIKLLRHCVTTYVIPAREEIARLGFNECLPNIEFMIAHADVALDQFEIDRYPQALKSLEEALTNFHEIVDNIRPPEIGCA